MTLVASTSTHTEAAAEPRWATQSVLVVERRGGRSAVSELRSSPPLALRPLGGGGHLARVAIVQSSATLVAGDAVALRVVVGPGALLELIEISATLCHPVPAERSIRQLIDVEVLDGGGIVLAEQPLILAAGTRLERFARIELQAGARCLHREALVLGREGEHPGTASVRTRVQRSGRPVLDDTLDTSDLVALRSQAVLGGARCLASAGLWGAPPPAPLPLDALVLGPHDTLVRALGPEARSAQATIAALWPSWRSAAIAAGPS